MSLLKYLRPFLMVTFHNEKIYVAIFHRNDQRYRVNMIYRRCFVKKTNCFVRDRLFSLYV